MCEKSILVYKKLLYCKVVTLRFNSIVVKSEKDKEKIKMKKRNYDLALLRVLKAK